MEMHCNHQLLMGDPDGLHLFQDMSAGTSNQCVSPKTSGSFAVLAMVWCGAYGSA